MLQAIYENDKSSGGSSYWVDRMLQRPFSTSDCSCLLTRGRALYMYTNSSGTLGFAGGYAYRERPTGNSQSLYTIGVSGQSVSESTSQRVQYPSYFSSVYTSGSLSIAEKKFITYNNVAVTNLTITNTSSSPSTNTLVVSSPIMTTPRRT